ncbi:MAG: ABC transporter permease [Saccharothrix sp.]|nr:ABC transporter permease [Saccharothrix sp.]
MTSHADTLPQQALASPGAATHPAFDKASAPPPVSQLVLTRVELRKLVDTRSGRWLLAVIGVSMIGMTCLIVFAGDKGDRTSADLFLASQMGLSILLPVVGILSVTAEWSQRTGSTTFALVPRRSRIVWAKVYATILLALAGIAVSAVVTVGGHALALATDRADGGWSIPVDLAATRILDSVLAVVSGIAFGMLLSNPLLAILSSYAVPIVLGVLGETVSALDTTMAWLSPGQALGPLSEEGTISAIEWARIATTTALFTVAPFVAGLWHTTRREIV